jgi:DNA-binding NarL/FixJ family response regulator
MEVKIGIVDDHTLLRQSLTIVITNTFAGFTTSLQASNGKELLRLLEAGPAPDIILLDVSMPEMNGIETATALRKQYPKIKMAALSTHENDYIIINMLRAGCCAYLHKNIDHAELKKALEEIHLVGHYNGDAANVKFRRLMMNAIHLPAVNITAREMEFLQFACSDLTYQQIASKMNVAERTIDGYRQILFEKLKVQSRVGMVMEAIRNGWVSV